MTMQWGCQHRELLQETKVEPESTFVANTSVIQQCTTMANQMHPCSYSWLFVTCTGYFDTVYLEIFETEDNINVAVIKTRKTVQGLLFVEYASFWFMCKHFEISDSKIR